jgi:hypothetical protein
VAETDGVHLVVVSMLVPTQMVAHSVRVSNHSSATLKVSQIRICFFRSVDFKKLFLPGIKSVSCVAAFHQNEIRRGLK